VAAAARVQTEQHTVSVEAPPSVPAWVDPLRLEQVLTNLVGNAIKYSPQGGPIALTLAVDPGGATVRLAVRDWGLGIPTERRAHIFECFYQAHADHHRSGLGLGLYISQEIVALHGGRLEAEFPEDGGSRFIVTLPTGRGAGRGDNG
jgi:signal transduction histidine kinase